MKDYQHPQTGNLFSVPQADYNTGHQWGKNLKGSQPLPPENAFSVPKPIIMSYSNLGST